MKKFFLAVYDVVKKVPPGKVTTYGQVATLLGNPRSARIVGWALHQLRLEDQVPWQRVVNSRGLISTTCLEHNACLQAKLLQKEGVHVEFKEGVYLIDLKKYLWMPGFVFSAFT